MTFLNTAFLFLLSAVSIPLIIHFLSKRRIKTIEFSSLRFLEQMQKSRMRWLKIKELILLLLRMLVIALIVMAFARPTLRGFAGSSKAKSSAVIILDRSASMDGEGETGSLFEEAKRLGGKLIDSFDAGDQITIMTYPADGQLQPIGPTNPGEKLKSKLAAIELSYQNGNIGEALTTARDILNKSPDLNQEIYILSDMQSGNFRDLSAEVLTREPWKKIHVFTISPHNTGAENIGISDVILPPQLLVPGENFEIEAELLNHGRGGLENVLVGVIIDGERKAQTTVALPPGQPTRFRFALKLDMAGDHGGYIEIDHDSFEPDNKRYFSLHIPEKINLLVVSPSGGSHDPIGLALDRPEAGQIGFTGIGAVELLRQDLTKYKVMLLDDMPSLDVSKESAVLRFAENGGGVLIILGNSSEAGYWQKFLPQLAGIRASAIMGKKGEYITWDNFNYEHPIFSIYSPDPQNRARPIIPELKVFFYHTLDGGIPLASSAAGINLMAQSKSKPIIVIATGMDMESSDLPAHSFFIPLLVRSIEYLGSQNTGGGTNGILGEALQWRLPGNITGGLTLLSPQNTVEDLQAIADASGSAVKIAEYGQPGIYTLRENDKKMGLLSFNVDKAESDGEILSAGDLGDRLGAAVKAVAPDSDLKATVLQARFGRELWKEFLALALLLLIMESILGRTTAPKLEGK